eukprot:scaffold1359_cov181-Skeletonema_menzelii.AAC.1
MGNVQSELLSNVGGANEAASVKAAASTATKATAAAANDYDPRGEVIPDVTPFELLRTFLKLEKFERCLSCVPLNIDPRSPTSQERDITIEKMAAAMSGAAAAKKKKGGKGVGAEKNNVDVMSTIEEGEDDDDSTSLNTDEKQREQQLHHQQQQYQSNTDAWKQAKVNQHDPNANLWDSDAPNTTGVGGSDEFSAFNPDKLAEQEEYGSAEYTEFDPDAILAAEEQQQKQQQQQQQHVLSAELDNVLMMRSEENTDDLFEDESASQSEQHPVEETTLQHFIGLTEPMDVAQRACNATYQHDVEELLNDVRKLTAAADNDDDCYHKDQSDWQDNHQLTIKAEVGDANKIANQHFDDIISDFELSPRPYSNVRSFRSQRAQKQRRNRRKSSSNADDTPLTSNTAFFVEETTVGRKLNGISPKAKVYQTKNFETSPTPSYESETIPDPMTGNTYASAVNQNQGNGFSNYPDDDLDTTEQYAVDASADYSNSSACVADTDQEDDVKSHSSCRDEVVTDGNVIDAIVSESYSADETVTESVDSSDKEQTIVSDLSGESTVASSAFEETHAKLKGFLTKASTDSDSANDSVNWDNLAYSVSDGSLSNKEDGEYSYDEIMRTRQSGDDEIMRTRQSGDDEIMAARQSGDNEVMATSQSSEEETYDQRPHSKEMNAASGNEENLTPTITTKEIESRIKQMKKQHEDELQTYLNESHNTPRHQRYIEVQRRIDAMREQYKTNIDNMRAAMKETDDNRNPPNSGRNKGVSSPSTSSRFIFDDNVVSKMESREKSIRELIKQNAELEEEMKQIRSLSPRSPDSSKFSPKSASRSNALSSKSYSLHNIRRYSPRIESSASPASASDEPEAYEARETLSTMIYDANANEERMNTRVNGMIADIKIFLEENDKVQERLSKDIMSYGV